MSRLMSRRTSDAATARGRRTRALVLAGTVSLAAAQVTGAPASADQQNQPGQASAQSSVFSIAVRSGGAPLLPTSVGAAGASYVETEAQASSASVALGGVGFLLSAIPLCGQPLLPASSQPHPLTADSAAGPASETTAGNFAGAGTESVSVNPSPESATATTKPVTQSLLGGMVDVSGTATSTVRYGSDGTQQSGSSVTENVSLAGGLVEMDGMHWSAGRRSGGSNSQSATFSFGEVHIGGGILPLDLPAGTPTSSVIDAINTVIGPAGLRLTLPSEASDQSTGTTAIGPLQVHFSGSGIDRQLVGPIAQQVAALQQVLSGQTTNGSDCSKVRTLLGNLADPIETVDTVAFGIAEGAGGIDLDLGGASASTQAAVVFANPFADNGSSLGIGSSAQPGGPSDAPTGAVPPGSSGGGGAPVAGSSLSAGTTAPGSQASPAIASSATGSTAAGTAVPLSAGAAPPGSAPKVSVRCVTTSPAGGPSCSNGSGEIAGAVTVAAAVAFIGAEIAYSRQTRRRRRRRPGPSIA